MSGEDRNPDRLPSVCVAEVIGIDEDGVATARPVFRRHGGVDSARIVVPLVAGAPAFAPRDRLLLRVKHRERNVWRGRVIRRLGSGPDKPGTDRNVVGIVRRTRATFSLVPVSSRRSRELEVRSRDLKGAGEGDLVAARQSSRTHACVDRVLAPDGQRLSPGQLAMFEHEIPHVFSGEALAQAAGARPPDLSGDRLDLRAVPFVTIDDADARDFDDAVWAEADDDGGWHIMVAIADVAHYVRPGDVLDREARVRGNSVYFPDRVVPMLPETLSNGLCSLRPGEERACLVADIRIAADGRRRSHRFLRAVIRSAARLTYEEVQRGAAVTGAGPDRIAPLWCAFGALQGETRHRGALDLTLPETRVLLDSRGKAEAVGPRAELDSHRLIEALMVCANQAAAETLGRAAPFGMYRVHDPPAAEKVEELRLALLPFGIPLARGQTIRPALFNRIVESCGVRPERRLVNRLIVRSQSRACYAARDTGHFGLGLSSYTHFTSPIRRYADLIVHRLLIDACGLGDGGDRPAPDELARICSDVSYAERRAAMAERGAIDRYAAEFVHRDIGACFPGMITSVQRFGLFVSLGEGFPDALLPASRLPPGLMPRPRRGIGAHRHGSGLAPGKHLHVLLEQANALTGQLQVSYVGG